MKINKKLHYSSQNMVFTPSNSVVSFKLLVLLIIVISSGVDMCCDFHHPESVE